MVGLAAGSLLGAPGEPLAANHRRLCRAVHADCAGLWQERRSVNEYGQTLACALKQSCRQEPSRVRANRPTCDARDRPREEGDERLAIARRHNLQHITALFGRAHGRTSTKADGLAQMLACDGAATSLAAPSSAVEALGAGRNPAS